LRKDSAPHIESTELWTDRQTNAVR